MKKVYISLPITTENYKDQRNHAFIVATDLGIKGYDVISPFDINPQPTTPFNEAMGKCIETLLDCDIIYMCKGWNNCNECKAELQVALVYGKDVITE